MGEIGWPVRHVSEGYKGVVVVGLVVEEHGAETVATGSETNSEEVQGQDFTRGSGVVNDGITPKK